jgi:signal transduction histidine kinase
MLPEDQEESPAHTPPAASSEPADTGGARKATASREECLAVLSHDLRNALGATVGLASLIAQVVARDNHVEQVLKYAERIQRTGERMDRLIGNLVDVASVEAGTLPATCEVGDPADIVLEVVSMFQAAASSGGISLSADIVPPPALAVFDAARIGQVLMNLLTNAIAFTPRAGKVVVRLERIGDEMRFSVSDTGAGIPADKMGDVFERFLRESRNDRRGVGVGLYIAKAIVQGHGGRISAESRVGEGSTFAFTLPVYASA